MITIATASIANAVARRIVHRKQVVAVLLLAKQPPGSTNHK